MAENPNIQQPSRLAGAITKRLSDVSGKTGTPSAPYYLKYSQAPPDLPEQPAASYQNLPNYEKLSWGERTAMGALAGIPGSVTESLEKFSNSWAGKALAYFDVLAEGLERGVGTASQVVMTLGTDDTADVLGDQFKAAWYAGSLASDYANFSLMFESDNGKLKVTVPQDLPGIEGLITARQDIYRLMQNGMSGSDALAQVRGQAYKNAGALAIRMQANDLLFHLAADPLNVIAGWAKPIERASVAKILGAAKAVPENVVQITKETQAAIDVARLALKQAEEAGDATKVVQLTDEIASMEGAIRAVEGMAQLGPWEQRLLRLTGNMPGEVGPARKFVQKLLSPFNLTPAAKAYEYVDTIQHNVIAFIMNSAKDPAEAVRSMQRLASGTLDARLAHMIATPQGALVRGVAEAMAIRGTSLLGAYDATTFERRLLDSVATVLGETPVKLMSRLKAGEANVIATLLTEKIGSLPDVAKGLDGLFASFGKNPANVLDELAKLPGLFKGADIYTADLLKLHLTNMVADVAAEAGVKMFGVKARGTLLAASEALKAAETLAFLKLNPAYPVMNWVNNNMTMIARGAFGSFGVEYAEKLWGELGFSPPRLRAGIGMAGEAENLVTDAIAAATRGEHGALNKITDALRGINVGKFNMGKVAQSVERRASMIAYTTGYLRGNKMFSSKFLRLVSDFDPALAKSLGDDITGALQDAVRSSRTQAELDAKVLGQNLRINMRSILDDASKKMGYDIEDIISPEFTASVEREILDAANKGPMAVTDAIAGIRGRVQSHIDGLVEEGIKNLVSETAAKIQAEGPGAFVGMWGNITDEFYFAHPKHADNVRRITDAIAEGADARAIDLLWRQGLQAEDAYMGRMWNRLEAYVEGMRKGGKTAGIPSGVLDEVASNFRKWRSGWQGFFKWRNSSYAEFFDAGLKGQPYKKSWDALVAESETRYIKLVDAEDAYISRVDQLTGGMLPQEQQALYGQYRMRVADWRRLDREMVKEYTARIRSAPAKERKFLWEQMWEARRENWAAIAKEESAAKAASMAPTEAATAPPKVTPGEVPPWQQAAIMDLNELVPDQMYMGTGIDQLWFTRGDEALDAIGRSASEIAGRKPMLFGDIPEGLMPAVRAYIDDAKTGIASRQVASMRYAEFVRDSALLNYNRRYNYNTYLGAVAPYEFWFTQSIYKWALHSLDRPAMLSSYLRIKQFLETAYRPEGNLPSRLRGSLRIHLPFLPDWMGDDVFVDPMRALLPFDRFAYPFEEMANQQASDAQMVQRKLDELVEKGLATPAEAQAALASKSGPLWDRAEGLARLDDGDDRKNAFDIMTMFAQPHAPLMAAYNLARGKPEEISSMVPLTRTIGGIAGAMGIDPAGPYNPEAALRRSVGLPAFDKWDDYRVDRMLSNMAGDGDITAETAILAMTERGKSQDPETLIAYQEAYKRAAREWGLGAMGSVIGIPPRFYPTGEEKQRQLTDKYEAAWKAYEDGDPRAIQGFYENHPEYEARLALFRPPEERLRRFLIDGLWDKWNDMPKLWQDEAKEQLGEEFQLWFLNKETRGYDAIPLESLQLWVKMLGGKTPGTLETKLHIALAPAETAHRAQIFYDTRNQRFPQWYALQSEYYRLDEGSARRAFRNANPQLSDYFAWRRDWLLRNPDAAPYLTDEPPTYGSAAEYEQAVANQPNLTREEWQSVLGYSMFALVEDHLSGEPLPNNVRSVLDEAAKRIGLSGWEAAIASIGGT